MVIDTLANAATYASVHPGIEKALGYLASRDFSRVEPGRYDIDADNCFALVQRYYTRPIETGRWEAHRKYIDVQYVAVGCERMGYADLDALTVAEGYDESKDATMLEGEGSFFLARQGTFAVFYPRDAHMPGIAVGKVGPVVKVVVKVRV
jgi:YhcH/YjgK/YiaL family protein